MLLHKIDTTLFKGTLANRLSIAPGDPGSFWLHSDPDTLAVYAREMTAEVWNPEKNFGITRMGRPNHAWDCEYLLPGSGVDAQYFQTQAARQSRQRGQPDRLRRLCPALL